MKKYIIGIIIGAISTITIVVGADYIYHADQVSYTPSNSSFNVDNVQSAINELYSKTTTGATKNLSIIYSSTGVKQLGVKGIVYLDPTNLQHKCNASNTTIGSGTSGCMKWYIYDDKGSYYSLILDHNIKEDGLWASESENILYEESGAYQPIQDLHWDSSLNTTLITKEELESILNFDLSSCSVNVYMDSKLCNTTRSIGKGASAYAWLIDNLSGCEAYGCDIENSNASSSYMTRSIDSITSGGKTYWVIWYVQMNDTIERRQLYYDHGIRPVITISKDKIN